MVRRPALFVLALVLLSACSTPAAPPSDGSAPPSASAPPAMTLPLPVTAASAAASGEPAAPGAASGEPAASASAAVSGEPAASAAPEEKIPEVKVANIGMHIGGGPNDAPTKAPIRQSVEPHFDELRKCFALVEDKKKGGDFGLDLLIDKAGGKAQVSHARTTMKGAGFKECMVAAFEAIDFKKPRGGTTMVSYSVRFTP